MNIRTDMKKQKEILCELLPAFCVLLFRPHFHDLVDAGELLRGAVLF